MSHFLIDNIGFGISRTRDKNSNKKEEEKTKTYFNRTRWHPSKKKNLKEHFQKYSVKYAIGALILFRNILRQLFRNRKYFIIAAMRRVNLML